MRIAPLAFCLDPKESTAQKIIWDVTRITHRNEEAYAGALAVVFAVRAAWTGAWCGEDRLLSIVIDALQETALRSRLYEFTQLESLPLPEVGKRYGHSGYVVNSVPLALLGAQRIASLGFKGLIEEIVLTGGDTDTIASISGQIVGTLIGFQAIPQDIVALLPDQSLIERVAAMFSQSVLKKRIA
jgi:ADP-ribosylglycohydrolase